MSREATYFVAPELDRGRKVWVFPKPLAPKEGTLEIQVFDEPGEARVGACDSLAGSPSP